MRAFLVALEVEPFIVDKVYSSLPLHCTLMHWFKTSRSALFVRQACNDVIADEVPIELVSETPAFFGKNADIPVHIVALSKRLTCLHDIILDRLNGFNVSHTELQFVGTGYRPHVTTCASRAFLPGTRHIATSAAIIEALNAQQLKDKKVVDRILFE